MEPVKYQVVIDVVLFEVVPEVVDNISVLVLVDRDLASQETDVLLEISLDIRGVSVVGLRASLKDPSLRVGAADQEVTRKWDRGTNAALVVRCHDRDRRAE